MRVRIGSIVEGHAERDSVPLLVRRIIETADPGASVDMPRPLRVTKSKLLQPGQLERAVELVARKIGTTGGVLVLLDSDDDCPAQLGPQLLRRARQARADMPIAVVLAKREFESWFLAAAESLRGVRRLPMALVAPADPEHTSGAKEWLSRHMQSHYASTVDQPALAARFDLHAARRADSFDKCYRDIFDLFKNLQSRKSG